MLKRFCIEDLTQINSWFEKRGLPVITPDCLPQIGFIVEDVAAGFLYQTDSKIAFIDNYISNPEVNRDTALDEITAAIIEIARDLGFKHLIAITHQPTIVNRAQKHGFVLTGNDSILTKGL